MIKSIFAVSILLAVIGALFYAMDFGEEIIVVSHNNTEKKPVEITLDKVKCSECGSLIKALANSSQVVLSNGTTYFFDDLGCMLLWLNKQKDRDTITIWVYTEDTEQYILAQNAYYSRLALSPIGYGFGAYEIRLYGSASYNFEEVELFALRGETLLNPMILQLLIENKI